MMLRRRALLINAAVNSSPKPYDVRIISSLQIHQSDNETAYTPWYTGDNYTFNADSGLFTLTDGSMYPLRYSYANDFYTQLVENYCILQEISGSTMYYFPDGCTVSYGYDETTGLYTITAHGKIQKYTPILTSTNSSEA